MKICVSEGDDFSRETWVFDLFGASLVLESYRLEAKESKRHKLKAVKVYERLAYSQRDKKFLIEESDVPITDSVEESAKKELFRNVEVLKWSQHRMSRDYKPLVAQLRKHEIMTGKVKPEKKDP